MKNPISRLLLLLATFFYCYAVDKNFNASSRFVDCTNNNMRFLGNKIVFLAYFSKTYVNKYHWKINAEDPKLSEHDSVVASLLSVCLCRSEYPPLKFTTPYLESNGDDIIALCVIGGNEHEEFTSMGIYDDEELYDYLILRHQELIPASVIDPFKYESDASPSAAGSDIQFKCFDQFFMYAKSIMEQRTCLFSASITSDSHSIYSGPLMSFPLMNFSMENITKYCYTTVEKTTKNPESNRNYCFFHNDLNISRIACCCMDNPHACIPDKPVANYLYCLYGDNFTSKIPAEGYTKKFYKPACTLRIAAEIEVNDKNEDGIAWVYEYGASDKKCPDNDMVKIVGESKGTTETTTMETPKIILSGSNEIKSKNIDSNKMEKFCSEDDNSDKIFEITKCCSDRNFCNYDLISQDMKKEYVRTNCKHRPALFQFLYPKCEKFIDLRDNEIRNLYIDFNARILNETRRNLTEDLTFVIVEMIKEDSPECFNRTFSEANVFIPFLICYLEEPECIAQDNRRNFTCQYLNNIYQNKTDSWFCFVQLKLEKNSITKYDTVAGHLEIKNPSDCYKNNVYNHTFCCINVFDENQSGSDCTIKKLTDGYKKYLKEKTEIGKITHGPLTECDKHGINDDRDCFGEDGCFDIRSVESPKDEESHLAGCLGYAEDYTIQEKFEASLSLGCRLEENMNKCSMVYGPDGEQRIVCCCNEKDENGECKTKANELPKQIGKPVSTFKELNS